MAAKVELGNRIRKIRMSRGLQQGDLAEKLGVSRSAVSMWEKGHNEPPLEMIKKIAHALDVSPDRILYSSEEIRSRLDPTILELLDGDVDALLKVAASMAVAPELLGRQNDLPPDVIPIASMPHHPISILGEVAAGQPIFAEETYDAYIDGPEKADFALKVKGDSMVPTFLDGDVVYIKSTPDVANGTVAVIIIDDSATLKHVYKSDNIITLISDNPTYAPMVINLEEHDYVRIIGKVCGYTRMFRK